MSVGSCVVQWRPAGFVDIGASLDQALALSQQTVQRGQHQGAFILCRAYFGIQIGPANEHPCGFEPWLSKRQNQSVFTQGADRIDVKTAVHQITQHDRVVFFDSLEEIIIRAS